MSESLAEARLRFISCEECGKLRGRLAEQGALLKNALIEVAGLRQEVERLKQEAVEQEWIAEQELEAATSALRLRITELRRDVERLGEREPSEVEAEAAKQKAELKERISDLKDQLDYYCDGCETTQRAVDLEKVEALHVRIVERVYNEHHPGTGPGICMCEACEAYRRMR